MSEFVSVSVDLVNDDGGHQSAAVISLKFCHFRIVCEIMTISNLEIHGPYQCVIKLRQGVPSTMSKKHRVSERFAIHKIRIYKRFELVHISASLQFLLL